MATRDGDKIIRIGGAAASMADTALSVPQLLGGGRLDYLIFDYLAEGSMAIFGRMQAADAAAGYGTDFLNVHIGPHLRAVAEQGVRVIANAGGVNPAALVVLCLGISGALAGLAGMFEVSGPAGQISIDFNVGYGFAAIIVAFLGRLNPIGILLAGLLMALTYIGGELAQFMLGLPAAAIQAFQGMLLFFLLAVDLLTNYRLRLGTKQGAR